MFGWWILCRKKLTAEEREHMRAHGYRSRNRFQFGIDEQAQLEEKLGLLICRTCKRIAAKVGMQPENGIWGSK